MVVPVCILTWVRVLVVPHAPHQALKVFIFWVSCLLSVHGHNPQGELSKREYLGLDLPSTPWKDTSDWPYLVAHFINSEAYQLRHGSVAFWFALGPGHIIIFLSLGNWNFSFSFSEADLRRKSWVCCRGKLHVAGEMSMEICLFWPFSVKGYCLDGSEFFL
jgi:hypothetical protein